MDTINGFINFMLILVPTGVILRVVLCAIYVATREDGASYKKKAWHAVVYGVLAETIVGILKVAASYFGGGVVY